MHKMSNQLSRDVAIISGSVCTDCKPKVRFVHVVFNNLCVLYIVNVSCCGMPAARSFTSLTQGCIRTVIRISFVSCL